MTQNDFSAIGFLRLLTLACLAGGLLSCATTKSTSRSASSASYNAFNDDLSAVRPRYAAAPATRTPPASPSASRPATSAPAPAETKRPLPSASPLHINKRLDAVLDTVARHNRSIRYVPGYRIQIYVGNERTAVDQAKIFTYQNYPELNPYISFKQPTYRLKVGDFMRRMDAERYLSLLKQQFRTAMLLPDRVEIRKGINIK